MFEIFVDSGANIPAVYVEKYKINVIPFINLVDGRKVPGFEPGLTLEEGREREREKAGNIITPSGRGPRCRHPSSTAGSPRELRACSRPQERMSSYISLSSNISGTFNAARIAAEDLKEGLSGTGRSVW